MHRAASHRLIALSLLACAALGGCERRSHLVEQHLLEFGTLIEITLITADLNHADVLLREIESRLRAYRDQWHAWEDSDLTRLNRALQSGKPVAVPASLRELIALSRYYHALSDGLFNPALGRLVAAHGFHDGEVDTVLAAAIARDIPDMRDLEFDGERARSRHAQLQLDFGGIAKGYAVGLIGDYLDANGIGDYVINSGGDLQIAGNRFGRPWRVGIQNPFAPGAIARIHLEGRHSLFTSGNYARRFHRGGEIAHHIIDPRSGKSARGQSSATVLANDPVLADVAATALMIDGQRKAHDLALSLGIEDFLVVSDRREILVSRSFAEKLEISPQWSAKIVN